MTYPPPLRQLKSDLSRLELILMTAVAASNPSATPTRASKPSSKPCTFNMQAADMQSRQYTKSPIYKVANMQAARQLFET
jgi:hypothetical protein